MIEAILIINRVSLHIYIYNNIILIREYRALSYELLQSQNEDSLYIEEQV